MASIVHRLDRLDEYHAVIRDLLKYYRRMRVDNNLPQRIVNAGRLLSVDGDVHQELNGSVVHIEQVVRIRSRPAEEAASGEGPDDYGKGFERRVEEAEDTVRAPVVKVNKTVKGD